MIIGIGGGSGSGKSTIAALVADRLRPLSVEVINQDQFFKPPQLMPTYFSEHHRGERPDFNHPDAFDRAALMAACRMSVAHDVVIVEGILVLYFADVRALMDVTCYVTVDLDRMLARRTERNLAAGYGGTAEEIAWYNAECVTPQHQRFNRPTADHADVLVPNDDGQVEQRDRIIAEICRLARDRVTTDRRPGRS